MPSAAPNLSFDLQRHLYASFLAQQTSDVTLRVRGSWNAIYRLHRVVLIQAEFFKLLFTAGFVESKARTRLRHTSRPEAEWIDIVFDDPNITRAAFEICIARLYGGGPQLYIHPPLIPSTTHPLTPSPPFFNSNDIAPPPSLQRACPPDYHPASPRFLLSLLATSSFLSIPRVAVQALQSILSTVGPRTVMRYLNFGLGKGIGEPDPELDWDEPVAAVGLENVAELVEEEAEDTAEDLNDYHILSSEKEGQHLAEKLEETHLDETTKHCGSPAISSFPDSRAATDTSGSSTPVAEYHYGGLSDKVGEAAMCWLTRWGADICRYEMEDCSDSSESIAEQRPPAHVAQASHTARKRAATVGSGSATDNGAGKSSRPLFPLEDADVPRIWRRGGLEAHWARQVLSSDALFVKGEKERYDLCKKVVDMRRKEGIDPADEAEWEILFRRGIYYATMSLDQLMSIAQDVSPITGNPYVPLKTLQSAHWEFSLLQHTITARPGPSSPSPIKSRGKELEIALHTPALLSPASSPLQSRERLYYPVSGDSSIRIGDSLGLDGASMDQLFDSSGSRALTESGTGATKHHSSQASAFGLEQQAYSPDQCARLDPHGRTRWSPYPPLRFGVEFWDVESLKEKSRLHSHTIWYAGSLWNVYVQVVRKKTVQLGVYLHRQSSVDPIPPGSAPVTFTTRLSNMRSMQNIPSHHESASPTRSSTPHSNTSTSSSMTPPPSSRPSSLPNSYGLEVPRSAVPTVPATAPPIIPAQPYRDPRPKVSAYFAISCASATGASLTRFTSSPDEFSVSQSWGWKSSSLRTEEYLEVGEDGMIKVSVSPMGKEVSLRATVIVGLV